ncbi:MAG: leucine-rich repeat domain-containing protein [Firmicutes bacterium]|nr:leucine-rich repeat domain-containing protein [Bacillota bacterium]
MKRILTVALVFMLLFTFTSCGTGTLNRRKANPASDFLYKKHMDDDDIYIVKYIGTAVDVVIPDSIDNKLVSGIGKHAFRNSDIKSVDIPKTVVSIGIEAFCECKNLETVKFGANTVGILERAFYNCTSLKEVYLPKTLRLLERDAFSGCTSLETLFVPASLTTQNLYPRERQPVVFNNTSSLKNIILEEGTSMLDIGTFYGCTGLTQISLPASLKTIAAGAFAYCKNLTEITFEGDAPKITGLYPGRKPFDLFGKYGWDYFDMDEYNEECRNVKIYYHPDKEGWDTTPLREFYTMVPIEE